MTRTRLVALIPLLACALVLSGTATASASQPAPTLSWYYYGSLDPQGTVAICASLPLASDQSLLVQVRRGTSWSTKRTFRAAQLSGRECVNVVPAQLVSGPGHWTFRAVVPAGSASAGGTSQKTLTLVRAHSYASTESSPMSTTTAKNRQITTTVSPAVGQTVELQRKSRGHWKKVSSAKASRTGVDSTVQLPVPARAGQATYRAVVRASAWTIGYTTPSFTMHQTDMAKYASYIREARKAMANWCPKTPIYVNTPAVAGSTSGDRVGQASSSWSSWNDTTTLTAHIELRSGLTGKELKHVAQHECAHVLQGRELVTGQHDAETAHADQLYPGTGIEGQADCMAYYHLRYAAGLYYVSDCTRAQLTDAARMWRTYGKKYQAATYTWRN